MLKIVVPACVEQYDEINNIFIPNTKQQVLSLEHSLVSVSKWESKWQKPYLSREQKTTEEFIDYVRCMTLTQNVDPNVYIAMTSMPDVLKQVFDYTEQSMTATTFSKKNRSHSREIITAEVIYYWMIYYGIPFECQKWHLSRLLTLIRVCSEMNSTPKKLSGRELAARNKALNASRRQKMNSRG